MEPSQGAFIINIQPQHNSLRNSGTYTFTDHTSILKMRAAQHPIHIRILITCQDGRFHPIAIKVGHQNWARPLTIDSISCCNCTCIQEPFVLYIYIVHSVTNGPHIVQTHYSNDLTLLKVSKLATYNIGII